MVKGEAIPKPLPHPEDVIIDYQNGPRFIGPVTEQEQRMLDEAIRLRDVLIFQDALDRCCSKRLDGEALIEPGGAELLAMILEHFIPPRLRLSDGEWIWRVMKAESLSKRTLLKQLHEQWRGLGHPVARGFVFPDRGFVKKTSGEPHVNSEENPATACSGQDAAGRMGTSGCKHSSGTFIGMNHQG